MRVSKKIEKEVLQVYDTWLDSYLNGDVTTYDFYFDDDFHFIGSTNNEEFLSRTDTTKFFGDTAAQLAGKCDLRNETRIIEKFEECVFITHLFDAWFLNGTDYTYYGRFRFTNALKENKEGWRFIYQHFSTPDSKTDEGDTIGFDKVSAENLELKDAIKRRTFELEQKNRELEVETALQRIRAQAVAMAASTDLLDIVVTMRTEFTKLGHEAHYFWHMMWLPETYEKAMTSGDGSKIGFVMELPRHIHGDIPLLAKWEKSKKPTVVYTMNVEEAIDYVDKMVTLGNFKNIDPQAPTNDDIRHIGGLTFIMARTTHGEIGYSLPGVVQDPPKEDIDILVKFAGAFDLAHQRFLDLQNAEKQARETQIELALEKVRSRTMAMQHSDELAETSFLLDEQVRALGIKTWGCAFNIYGENESTEWFGNEAGVLHRYTVPREGIFKEYYQKGQQGESLLIREFAGKECIAHYEFMSTLPVIGDVLKTLKKTNNGFPEYQIDHVVYFKYGYLLFITREEVPEAHEVFKRFARVFEQTYTRFLDLQKAEAQAREAKIEAALERVRSRSMAMHNSEELKDVIQVLYDQFIKLNIHIEHAGFILDYKNNDDMHIWLADHNAVFPKIVLPYFDCAHWNDFIKAKKTGQKFFANTLGFEEKNQFYTDLFKHIPGLPEATKATYFGFEGLAISTVLLDNVGLYIENYSGVPFSEDENKILMRFGKVFQQSYTRFLDLQKSEAQAREARIEAALEKVRSRTMAMQQSKELPEAANVLFQEVQKLGIPAWSCGYNILSDDQKSSTCIMSSEGEIQSPFNLPLTRHKSLKPWYNAIKNNEDFFVYEQGGKDLEDHYEYMQSLPELKETFEQLKNANLSLPTFQVNHLVRFTQGFLLFITYEQVPHAHDIFNRFGKVFQQTYTRFLDLQRSEAQAREAQIEASLERVRSRSMAMHNSDELLEAGALLYRELSNLGVQHLTAGYILFDEKAHIGYSYGVNPADGSIRHQPVAMIHTKTKVMKSIVTSWKKQEPLKVIELDPEETVKHQTYIAETSKNFPLSAAQLLAISPERLVIHCFNFKQGYLLIVGGNRLPDDHQDMVVRFTNVFQQTYTRFLDLQKSEAQAREAKIETALERVRSRSMAMQRSDEIAEVAKVLYEQLTSLGGALWGTGFGFCEKNSDVDEYWFVNERGVMPPLKIPNTKDPVHKAMYKGWQDNIELFSIAKEGKELADHYKYMLTVPDVQTVFQEMLDSGISFPTWQKWHAAYFNHGYLLVITTEPYNDEEIFVRFAKVFEQSYTRFLDLQKAEAQARDAKIEASLERVRSRSMAMHNSEELQEVIHILHKELLALNISIHGGSFITINDDITTEIRCWGSGGTANTSAEIVIPRFEKPFYTNLLKGIKKGVGFFTESYSQKEKQAFFKHLFNYEPWASLSTKEKNDTLKSEGGYTRSCCVSKYTSIFIINHFGKHFTETENDILKRFGKVFEQTYTRFLDLQKAEAQARESKIEASLEKVRSVALSLQKSDDMLDIAKVLYEQLLELGFSKIRNAIIDIHNDEEETFLDYDYSHDMSSAVTKFSFYGDPVIEQQIKKVQSGSDAFFEIELKGKELEELIETRLRNGEKDDPRLRNTDHLTYNLYSFGNGAIGISNFGILSDDEKVVLKRFRNVFTFAYKRYTDLANAEAQAREAKIEAALEKVRSVALSMNESTDLLNIAKAFYEQLVVLGFSDIRNAIIDVNNEDDHTFSDYDYSDEMGGTVTQMSYDDDPTLEEQLRVIASTTDGYSEMVLKGKQLQDLIEMRRKNGEADDPRLLKADSVSYILYAFGNGAVGISNFGILSKEQKSILDRFRNVFTFAYQRFKDLQVKEEQSAALLAEKQQLEATLSDLKLTQSQLIQSEKMASLGELTAGIAHEIQNPLNFVNNFSEVSNELIDEMNEEIEKGDFEEAKYIAADIKQNLEKINHHGKRADAIVKGMLQHSRKSTAEKEPTDINKLADEYLRLAYHGLRAKDKSFNANLETHFDDSLGKVKVIPQDMGRVILNLITNAFYATNERKKQGKDPEFKPTVSVTTKKEMNYITISVKDNGNGIPKHVVDKIFQPFFTTKPTGEGTGLGLSMSYDIVTKGHGGELSVNTKTGEFTEFIITLPN